MEIPVFIINYNLLTWPKDMCEKISEMDGLYPVIVDNHSTYKPVLDWYKSTKVKVVRLQQNLGHRAVWDSGLINKVEKYCVISDPDLDLATVPKDVLQVMTSKLEKYPFLNKVGLSLEISDLNPNSPVCEQAKIWETPFWGVKIDREMYNSPIDTTFALYDLSRSRVYGVGGARLDRPYTARHLPFYVDRESITEEYVHYLKSANSVVSTMSRYLRDLITEFENKHGVVKIHK